MRQNDGSADTSHLYAWLSRESDGTEGIIAAPVGPLGVQPLVSADEGRARRLAVFAAGAARARGCPAQLVRFTRDPGSLDEVP